MRREWKMYKDWYYVSNFGEVKHNGKLLKPYSRSSKQEAQRIDIKGKEYEVHRMVAELFLPNPDKKKFIYHIDGDNTNNRVDNLRWSDSEYVDCVKNRLLSKRTTNTGEIYISALHSKGKRTYYLVVIKDIKKYFKTLKEAVKYRNELLVKLGIPKELIKEIKKRGKRRWR